VVVSTGNNPLSAAVLRVRDPWGENHCFRVVFRIRGSFPRLRYPLLGVRLLGGGLGCWGKNIPFLSGGCWGLGFCWVVVGVVLGVGVGLLVSVLVGGGGGWGVSFFVHGHLSTAGCVSAAVLGVLVIHVVGCCGLSWGEWPGAAVGLGAVFPLGAWVMGAGAVGVLYTTAGVCWL